MTPLILRRRGPKRFTWGTTPEDAIRSQFAARCPAGLRVAFNREDTKTVLDASRVVVPGGRGTYTVGGKWKLTLDVDELVQLTSDLLVAAERDFGRGAEDSDAASLRGSLLDAIEIEEI